MGLLSVEAVNTYDHGTILDVWEIGGAHRKLRPPFQPYFYSLQPTSNGQATSKKLLSDLKFHTVWRVPFDNTDDLERARSRWTVEDNFPFKQRVAVDMGYKFQSKYPRLLAWDIETKTAGLSPNWRKDKIVSIATWGDTPDSHKFFYAHTNDPSPEQRRTIIQEFLAFIRTYDTDVLVDFFGRFYDVPTLIQNCQELAIRCALGRDGSQPYIYQKEFEKRGKGKIENTVRIRGRVHFDVHKEVDQDYTLTLAGLKDRTLKTVAKHYGMNPIQVDYDKMGTLTENELREYNLSDARCTYDLSQIYFRGLYELAEYLNVPIDMIVQRQPSHVGNIVIGRRFHKQDIISDGENADRYPAFFGGKFRSNEGAVVRCYRTGIFLNVTHKDFHSMYPNIMRAFNLSPETVRLIETRSYTGKYNFAVKGKIGQIEVPDKYNGQVLCEIDMSCVGIIPEVITDIINQRAESKNLWTQTQDLQYLSREGALKIVANALYGYNVMVHSRYGNVLVGVLTTSIGRMLILDALNKEEKAGNTLLEADTDGEFVIEKNAIEYDARPLFPSEFKTEYLTQGKDTYEGIILIDEKSYVLSKKGKLIKHGSGILGRNIPLVVDDFVAELCNGLFKKEEPFTVIRSWNKDRLRDYPTNAFVSYVNLSKRPDSYNEGNLYANLIAALRASGISVQWGDRINYVKATNGYVPTILLRDCDRIDYKYYQSRMAEIASRILKQPFRGLRQYFDGTTKLENFK